MKKAFLVAAVVGMAFSFNSCQKENPAADFEYTETENGITITKYKGETKKVVIPQKINDIPVVAIGASAFSDMNLPSVSIPNSVSYIGEDAFSGNAITSVSIPPSVERMGNNAFDSKVSLAGNTPVRENSASDFNYEEYGSGITITGYKGETKDVVIPQKINNKPVVAIGDSAFKVEYLRGMKMGANLTSVIIPDSVKTIGDLAFASNELTSVSLGNSVERIGRAAFEENKLTNIIIGNSVVSIGDGAFDYNQLTGVGIGNSVKNIGDRAFRYNQLTSVALPDSIEGIGKEAFDPDVALTGNERITLIVQNNTVESPYTITDVKKDADKYAHFVLNIKLYERDGQNQQWFDRQKNNTNILIENRKQNNGENAFNVAISGNPVRRNRNSAVVSQTTQSYGFSSDYSFQNTFYYEPLDRVVNVEFKIKYVWVSILVFGSGGDVELLEGFSNYSRNNYINQKTNVDEPNGKYMLYQLSNGLRSSSVLPSFESFYKLCSNPDMNNGVIEALIN